MEKSKSVISVEKLATMALDLAFRDDYKKAMIVINSALVLEPDNPNLHTDKAIIYALQGQEDYKNYDLAQAYLQRASELNKTYFFA